jgi:hypothetical protein
VMKACARILYLSILMPVSFCLVLGQTVSIPIPIPGVPKFEGTLFKFSMSTLLSWIPIQTPFPIDVKIPGANNGSPLPSTSLSFIRTLLMSDTGSFQYFVFDRGRMNLTLRNTYNFDVTVTVEIYDSLGGTDNGPLPAVNEFLDLGTISSNTERSALTIVDGKRMSSVLQMKMSINTSGTLLVNEGALIPKITFDNTSGGAASLQSIKAIIAGSYYIVNYSDSSIQYDDSTFIKIARFSDGEFDVKITNQVPWDLLVGYEVKELRDNQGNPFRLREGGIGATKDSIIVPSASIFIQNVKMKDHVISSVMQMGHDTFPTNSITSSLGVVLTSAIQEKKVISKDDYILLEFVPKRVNNIVQPYVVSYYEGIIKPTIIPIAYRFRSPLPQILKAGQNLDSAAVLLRCFTTVQSVFDLKLTVTALLNGKKGLSLASPSYRSPDGGFRMMNGDTANILFDKTNSPIQTFLTSFFAGGPRTLPDSFLVEGYAMLTPKDVYDGWDNDRMSIIRLNDNLLFSFNAGLTKKDLNAFNELPAEMPHKFSLEQNYPNPFNPMTIIDLRLPIEARVRLSVFDILGREVAVLVNEEKPAGRYSVTWDARGFSSGIYFYKLEAGNFVETKKLLYLK